MTFPQFILLAALAGIATAAAAVVWQFRRRNMHIWLGSALKRSIQRRVRGPRYDSNGPIHVLLCIADHFEPAWSGKTDAVAPEATSESRITAWVEGYPRLFGAFRDSDGRPPRHTFFYPIDQYQPRHVERLAALCREGFGEVEIHLHHDNDTAENLEYTLRRFQDLFAREHGLLGRWPDGRTAYGFVHGNWALDNARCDGRWCGVNNELDVLRRTGCFADFTLPSAPDATQTRKINSLYYAVGGQHRCKSHDSGIDVGSATAPTDGLMLIQGPLGLRWTRGKLTPRIENGCLQHGQPPSMERLDHWIRTGVGIPSRPDWVFVKLHTHGATEANQRVLLGEPMISFHRALAQRAARNERFHFHYVTAREMYNLAKAAEAGWTGSVALARDFHVASPRPNNLPVVGVRAA